VVEQPIRNRQVVGSTPTLGSTSPILSHAINTASVMDTLSNTAADTVQGVALFPEAVVITPIQTGTNCS
jgi:hypothetical protein